MNLYFLIAGVMSAVTVAVHVLLGGVRVVRPMRASSDLNETVKAVLYGCWHAFTVLHLMLAAGFFLAAFGHPYKEMAIAGTVTTAVLCLLSCFVILAFRQRFRRLPHWAMFGLTALSGSMGLMA